MPGGPHKIVFHSVLRALWPVCGLSQSVGACGAELLLDTEDTKGNLFDCMTDATQKAVLTHPEFADNREVVMQSKAPIDADKDVKKFRKQFSYESLGGIACLLLVVDKGRLGDTFPRGKFAVFDLRLHTSTINVTSFEQELGRVCQVRSVQQYHMSLNRMHCLVC